MTEGIGVLRLRNPSKTGERPVLVLFQNGFGAFWPLLIADLNRLPFEPDDGASMCGGTLPAPWVWEDANPAIMAAVRAGDLTFRGFPHDRL
jgi:hypothetical protein